MFAPIFYWGKLSTAGCPGEIDTCECEYCDTVTGHCDSVTGHCDTVTGQIRHDTSQCQSRDEEISNK